MIPTATYSESQVGNRFVDLSADRLPATPQQLAEPSLMTVVYFHMMRVPGVFISTETWRNFCAFALMSLCAKFA
jgi:hypothetical protein